MAMLLYNSLTQKKEKFIPLEDNNVKMYVCGVTPYDTTHLGHAFTYVFFDTLRRYLNFKNYNVGYAQNVTDIDDDILKRARLTDTNWQELGNLWIERYLADMKTLNVQYPDHFIKATAFIPSMVEMISSLIKKGCAYEINGNVYFEVAKDPSYGLLSKYNLKQMAIISGERGGNPQDPCKRNPLDFLLWQKSKQDEPFWDSPWGKGRPGWHIECTAMINSTLGPQIDIHGGGRDLVFPHHESEIAQAECATGLKPYVKYWVHTAMVMYQGEKMAKSLGNLIMVKDLLRRYSPNAVRWLLLSHHYRQPWEYDEEKMIMADRYVKEVVSLLKNIKTGDLTSPDNKEFTSRMDNDMDTPSALSFILKLTNEIKNTKNKGDNKKISSIYQMMSVLGFKL